MDDQRVTIAQSAKYAPIALFGFNRPKHIRATLNALARNQGSSKSDLYVFVDGARNEQESSDVEKVVDIASQVTAFRSLTIRRRPYNVGLRSNIESGISEIIEQYGRVVVFEDDIISSPACLDYLNQALDLYSQEKNVWHISSWAPSPGLAFRNRAYFSPVMHCWGWATWSDRWRYYERDPNRLVETWTTEEIRKFNLNGAHDFWDQIVKNHEGIIDTWAIFWYATIFGANGLCLNPTRPLIRNIGMDGTGENCRKRPEIKRKLVTRVPAFPNVCAIDSKEFARVQRTLRLRRIVRQLLVK